MRFLSVLGLIILTVSSASQAMALSCVQPDPDAIPQNKLIVRAKILDIKTAMHVPYVQDSQQQDDIVTFEVIDIYRGPQDLPKTFKATFSSFFKTWGPHLKAGDEGAYLFDHSQAGGWQYAGPGGCTFVSDKAWEILRSAASQ